MTTTSGPYPAQAASVRMIGNAHIDPVWIWDWHEGLHEVLATFRSALDRLDENPDLVFCASSAAFFEWVEHVDPDMFDRIKKTVSDGRWMLVGGQWVEPDCNIPSGEAVCRQFLYGQRYFASRFGTVARVGWNIDAFGHAGSLPQILRAAGLCGYVMMRPDENEKAIAAPLFSWVGCDGTAIPTYRVPFAYATEIFGEDDMLRERSHALRARAGDLGHPLMCLFGVGNHGGGPTRLALSTIAEITAETDGDIRLGDPEAYFDDVAGADLPVVAEELQWHAVGCYTARTVTKQSNAYAEAALVAAEKLERICHSLTRREVLGATTLEGAWQSLLFSQFHDALGGTCTERSAAGIDLQVAQARAQADRIATAALHTLAQSIDTWTEGAEGAESLQASSLAGLPIPLVVCNPLSWSTVATVEIPYPMAACSDDAGTLQPVQRVPSGEITFSPFRTLVQVSLPPLGYRRFWLHAARPSEGQRPDGRVSVEHDESGPAPSFLLTNGTLDVRIGATTGVLSHLFDHRSGTQLLEPEGLHCVLLDDNSDTWSHGVKRYDGDEQGWTCERVEVVASGPVRATVRAVYRFGSSVLTQDVSLGRHASFVDVRLRIAWHERHMVTKCVVPVALGEPRCTAGAPYGAAARAAEGHEDPMVGWVDLSGREDEAGITCTTVGTYGYDTQGARTRLTLVRSPRVADHGWGWGIEDPAGYPYLDQGLHDFRVRLHPHTGTWRDGRAVQWAEEHLMDVMEFPFVLDTWHEGSLPAESSLLDEIGGTITVTTMKRAERAAGTVLRVVETTGRPTQGTVSVRGRPTPWSAPMRAHQIMTLFVPDNATAPIREVDLCEFEVDPPDEDREDQGT